MAHDSATGRRNIENEIEVTPEMLKAGHDMLTYMTDCDVRSGLITDHELKAVYIAMRRLGPEIAKQNLRDSVEN